jgi:phage terminase large subunit-like protein
MLSGYDVYLRKVVEGGEPIFPEAYCATEAQRVGLLEKGIKVESIERLKATNQSKFWSQYCNDPLDESLLEFKREWFQRFKPTPELMGMLGQVPPLISIDPAYSLSKSADFTGICVTKTDAENNVYVVDAKGVKVNLQMLMDEVFNLVKIYKPYKVLIEAGNQVSVAHALRQEMTRRNVFFVLEELKSDPRDKKIARIRGLVRHYANRRIWHAPHLQSLEDQLIEFPRGAHDDVIDALSFQEPYWEPFGKGHQAAKMVEGSFEWWNKTKGSKRPTVIGKLFSDFNRR